MRRSKRPWIAERTALCLVPRLPGRLAGVLQIGMISLLVLQLIGPGVLQGAPPLHLLPEDALLVAALDAPHSFADGVLRLPYEQAQERIPVLQVAMLSPQFLAVRGTLAYAESSLGGSLADWLETIGGAGLALSVTGQNRILVVSEAKNEEELERMLGRVLQLVAGRPVDDDLPRRPADDQYEGISIYRVGELYLATKKQYLLVSSQKQDLVDALERTEKSLSRDLSAALERLPIGPPESIRWRISHANLPQAKELDALVAQPAEDFGQEMILGPFLSAISAKGQTVGVIGINPNGIQINWETSLPHDDSEQGKREGEQDSQMRRDLRLRIVAAAGESPSPLELPSLPNGTMGQISFNRDFALLWSEKSNLLTEAAAAQLDVADSQLSTAFGGFDFGEEVLGALATSMRIDVFALTSKEADYQPPVLPQAAFSVPWRESFDSSLTRRFRIAWQTVIGLVNVERGGQGQPQLELETLAADESRLVVGRYSLEDARELSASSVDLYANLAPTLATTPQALVIASRDETALRVANQLAVESDKNLAVAGNVFSLALDGQLIADALRVNRAPMLGQNMMEKGNSRVAAEREVDSIIGAVSLVDKLAARAVVSYSGMRGSISLQWDGGSQDSANSKDVQ